MADMRIVTATVDLANHTAVASVDTAVTVAGAQTSHQVIAVPPVTLEAGIAVQAAVVSADGTVTLRTTNASAGAINPASATWTFILIKESSV